MTTDGPISIYVDGIVICDVRDPINSRVAMDFVSGANIKFNREENEVPMWAPGPPMILKGSTRYRTINASYMLSGRSGRPPRDELGMMESFCDNSGDAGPVVVYFRDDMGEFGTFVIRNLEADRDGVGRYVVKFVAQEVRP